MRTHLAPPLTSRTIPEAATCTNSSIDNALQPTTNTTAKKLRVGFILLNHFTLAGFAGLIEALRLAADDGGQSKQIHAAWHIMSDDGTPRQASCGAVIGDCLTLQPATEFDYLIVCGGNGNLAPHAHSTVLITYLQKAVQHACIVGVCNGTFTLAQAGLATNRTVCINWNSLDAFRSQFPAVKTRTDCLFIDQGNLITCAGSTASIDLAIYLIRRHCGEHRAHQVVRHMLLQQIRPAGLPQPHFYSELLFIDDLRVQKAVHFMQQRLDAPPSLEDIAAYVNLSTRQLSRVFIKATGLSARSFLLHLRLRYGRWLLLNADYSVMEIALMCGFADASHFSREFRSLFHESPRNARNLDPSISPPASNTST